MMISIHYENGILQGFDQMAACYRDHIEKLPSNYDNWKGYTHQHEAEGQEFEPGWTDEFECIDQAENNGNKESYEKPGELLPFRLWVCKSILY